jgi:hypothetical protein
MTLPLQIEVRARCAEADDLSGLIFRMRITAGYKNPYGIFFSKTDLNGHTRLTTEEIEGQFTDHWEEGLMDYNGSIAEANDVVTIRLWDPVTLREGYDELLAWPLFTHERTRWQSRRDYLDYMASCRNDEFTFDGISVRLPDTRLLYVSLRRVVARQAV